MQSGNADPYETLGPAMIEALDFYREGDLDRALRSLRQRLREFDASTAPAHSLVMGAALLYAEWATSDIDDDSVLRWAWYGYRAALLLDGADANSTLKAAGIFAGVLTAREDFRLAAVLWETVAGRHQQAGDHRAHITARLSLAEVLHRAGSCGAAVQQATTALDAHPVQDALTAHSFVSLVRVLRLLEGCDRTDEALDLIRQWQLRPISEHVRESALVLGRIALGQDLPADAHQLVCAGRLNHRLGGTAGVTFGSLAHSCRRPVPVRHAFLAAFGDPDPQSDVGRDIVECPCTAAPALTGWQRFGPWPVLEALVDYLSKALVRRRARQALRGPGRSW